MQKTLRTPTRVVIVDSSGAMRELLASIFREVGDIQVVGSCATGDEAVKLVKSVRPDVITMDIHTPHGMNNLDAVRQIMRDQPTPMIIVTASQKPHDMEVAFQAMRAGALAVLNKPGLNDPETSQKLVQNVRLMAGVPVIHHWGRSAVTDRLGGEKPGSASNGAPKLEKIKSAVEVVVGQNLSLQKMQELKAKVRVIGIAASTGGPSAVASVIRTLPASFPLPLVLVQHFSPGFASGLADWLGTQTGLQVEIAAHGDVLQPGVMLLAPDDYHLQVKPNGLVELAKTPSYKGLRPSANPLFESLARSYGAAALGVILTGMGDDGADGMAALHAAGGAVIAQEEESCVVYGMPREVVARGAADAILTPEQIALTLEQFLPPTLSRGGSIS